MSTVLHTPPVRSSDTSSDVEAIRVAVLDDHPAMRAGLEAMLAPAHDLRFVGAAAAEEDLWALLTREEPAVLVLDLHHPGRDGLALCQEVKLRHPSLAVVLYSAAPQPEVQIAAVIAGADAILDKASPIADLLDAVRSSAVPSGHPLPVSSRSTRRAAARLDPSDHAIFAMRLAGNSPAEIAETLRVPVSAIRRRIVRITELLSASAGPAGRDDNPGQNGPPRAHPSGPSTAPRRRSL
jgi:DNA-binding NarL/FixJ family response regulator